MKGRLIVSVIEFEAERELTRILLLKPHLKNIVELAQFGQLIAQRKL